MIPPYFKAILYTDGSNHSFSAAVYAANLLKKMPNLHLSIVQVQENSAEPVNPDLLTVDNWPFAPSLDSWREQVILDHTRRIFAQRKKRVSYQVLSCNPTIPETVETLLQYAARRSIRLIIIGSRGLTTLQGVIFGCLAHTLLNQSSIPVLLVKKLPPEFLTAYLNSPKSHLRVVPPIQT